MADITIGKLVEMIKMKGLNEAGKYLSSRQTMKCSHETMLKDLDRIFKKISTYEQKQRSC